MMPPQGRPVARTVGARSRSAKARAFLEDIGGAGQRLELGEVAVAPATARHTVAMAGYFLFHDPASKASSRFRKLVVRKTQ